MEAKIRRPLFLLLLLALFTAPLPAKPEQWAKEIDGMLERNKYMTSIFRPTVFVGSSSIRLWSSLAQDFPGSRIVNSGFGGSELADSVYYADRIVIAYKPRIVVLYAGDNDIWAGKTPETVVADFKAFRAKLHAALPETKLIYLSIKPSPARVRVWPQAQRANQLIAAYCWKDPRCIFVDVATPLLDATGQTRPELYREDQLHLLPAGYAIWTRVLAPFLQP